MAGELGDIENSVYGENADIMPFCGLDTIGDSVVAAIVFDLLLVLGVSCCAG